MHLKEKNLSKLQKGKQKGKKGRQTPEWILNLKPGVYTSKELEEISQTTRDNATRMIKKYGAEALYKQSKINPNSIVAVYVWNGIQQD